MNRFLGYQPLPNELRRKVKQGTTVVENTVLVRIGDPSYHEGRNCDEIQNNGGISGYSRITKEEASERNFGACMWCAVLYG